MSPCLFDYQFTLIIVGDMSVGKTALLKYFTDGNFIETSDPTVGVDFCGRLIELDEGVRIKLQVWDAAGQERFRCIVKSYYHRAVGAILAYDITRKESFYNLPFWLNEVRQNSAIDEPTIFVIGTKIDLEQYREVSLEEAKAFALFHNIHLMETSSVTGKNVELCFKTIAEEIYKQLKSGVYKINSDFQGIKFGLMSPYDNMFAKQPLPSIRKGCC